MLIHSKQATPSVYLDYISSQKKISEVGFPLNVSTVDDENIFVNQPESKSIMRTALA